MDMLPTIIAGFYDHIRRFPELDRFFSSPSHAGHASRLQLAHWRLLFEAKFDRQYLQSVRRIGNVHCRLGLEPRWYIGSYSYILAEIFRRLESAADWRWPMRKHVQESHRLVRALHRIALIDMDIALSSYFDGAQQSKQDLLTSMAGTFEKGFAQLVRSLNFAVSDLSSSAGKQAGAAEDARSQSESVSRNSADATETIQRVSLGAAVLADALQNVASRINQSSSILARAVTEAEVIRSQVSCLGQSVDRIGTTVDLIQDVAERTRLLALNAAIEAARAGAAGRGFSVVASEVQQLAVQTAHATTNIKTHIEHIGSSSKQVSQSVSKITSTMSEMKEIEMSVVGSVEEHRAAAVTMAQNVDDGARFSSQIAQSIGCVARLIEGVSVEAANSLNAITHLVQLASQIDAGVDRFLHEISSA